MTSRGSPRGIIPLGLPRLVMLRLFLIDKVEKQNPVVEEQPEHDEPWEPQGDYSQRGEKISNKTHRSSVDPDSRIARKSNFSETYLGHGVSYVMDNKSRIILGADHNLPNRNADAETAVRLIARLKWAYKLSPRTLGADKGYATGLFLHWLLEQEVLPHVPIMDARSRNEKEIYPIEQFHYDAEKDQLVYLSAGEDSSVLGNSQAQQTTRVSGKS